MTELDLYGQLSIELGGVRDDLRAMREDAGRTPPQPIERVLHNGAAFPSSGVLAFNLGGPQQGRVWEVRSIAVGGVTPTTAAVGRADVFAATTPLAVVADPPASGSQPGSGGFTFNTGLAAGSTLAWKDQTTTLPNVAFYGKGDLKVHAGMHLYVVISSGTSTQVYDVNVRVDDFETAAYAMVRGV